MKIKLFTPCLYLFMSTYLIAQTNTLPDSGNVGVGTVTPSESLEVVGTVRMDKLIINESLPDNQIFSDYTDRNTKCLIMSAGKLLDATSGARSFNYLEFPVSNLNTQSGFWLGLEDKSYNQRFTFTASTGGLSWFRLADKNQSEYFKVLEYDDGNGDVAKILQMGKSNSRFRLGCNGNYETDHMVVVKNGSSLFEGDIFSTGNIGIGTTIPDSKLTVAGNIHAQEVKVTINAGADFVFKDDYNLPDLKDLEAFIKTNKHLPEIASEKEMQENGVLLAEMNIKLLQKIEELTLYTIEQQKQIQNWKKEFINQKITNKNLEDRLEKIEIVLNK